MNTKRIATVALMLFVAVSVVALVRKEAGKPQEPAQSAAASASRPAPAAAESRPAAARRVVAYYFHGKVRCATCRTIEAYAEEAIKDGFAGPLGDGRLEWRTVNVDEPDNRHYIDDFDLATRSVVLERWSGDRRLEWKNLQQVWQLVRDRDAFQRYVREETRTYLEAQGL